MFFVRDWGERPNVGVRFWVTGQKWSGNTAAIWEGASRISSAFHINSAKLVCLTLAIPSLLQGIFSIQSGGELPHQPLYLPHHQPFGNC